MENKEKTLLLKNGKDVYGEKIDILIVGEKIEKISEEISGKDAENLKIIDLKGNLVRRNYNIL